MCLYWLDITVASGVEQKEKLAVGQCCFIFTGQLTENCSLV